MIQLYNLLEERHEALVKTLAKTIVSAIPNFKRLGKADLQSDLEHHVEAWCDGVATGGAERQEKYFKFVAKARSSQGFSMRDLVEQQLLIGSVVRKAFFDAFPPTDLNNVKVMMTGLDAVEEQTRASAGRLCDAVHNYLQERLREHEEYLQAEHGDLGADLSKFILFKG